VGKKKVNGGRVGGEGEERNVKGGEGGENGAVAGKWGGRR